MQYSNAYATGGALDASIRKTLTNTFVAVGGMWTIAAATSYLTLGWQMGLGGLLGLFVASLVAMFGVFAFRKSGVGLLLLAVFAGLEGASIGPLLNHYLQMRGGAQMVATAAGLTALATFACAAYCVTTRKSFSRIGGFLFAGLIVLLVASLVAMFFPMPMLHLTISAVACLLFIGFMLYDIGEVVSGQQDNYIIAALGIFLDMLNFFLHVLRILGIFGSSDD